MIQNVTHTIHSVHAWAPKACSPAVNPHASLPSGTYSAKVASRQQLIILRLSRICICGVASVNYYCPSATKCVRSISDRSRPSFRQRCFLAYNKKRHLKQVRASGTTLGYSHDCCLDKETPAVCSIGFRRSVQLLLHKVSSTFLLLPYSYRKVPGRLLMVQSMRQKGSRHKVSTCNPGQQRVDICKHSLAHPC